MPTFITLHIIEHTLPIGKVRGLVKATKVLAGIPFCVMSEVVDKTSSQVFQTLRFPDASLDMQGTIGVSSDIRLEDILNDMKRWSEESSEELQALSKLYKMQRGKK
jgi:hypothetical protein